MTVQLNAAHCAVLRLNIVCRYILYGY